MKKALALALVATMALSGSSFGVDVVAPFVNDNAVVSFNDIATTANVFFTFVALANLSGAAIPCQVFYADAAGTAVLSVNSIDGDTFTMPTGTTAQSPARSGAGAAETAALIPDATPTGDFVQGSMVVRYTGAVGDIVGEVRQWANLGGQVVMGVAPMAVAG